VVGERLENPPGISRRAHEMEGLLHGIIVFGRQKYYVRAVSASHENRPVFVANLIAGMFKRVT